ncbi:MAG: hypothetical protein FH748_12960 [Balneolaceae bacterium]|nr:hypothetical protein [Balneolaceae bacterium]
MIQVAIIPRALAEVSFDGVVRNPDTLQEVQIDLPQMQDRRQGFIRSIVSAMRQVSELGLGLAIEHDEKRDK